MVNIGTYLAMLEKVLIPWLERHFNLNKVMLVQDSVPTHASHRVQSFLSRRIPLHTPEDIWPPNSVDLNPCDFWMWGVMKERYNSRAHASISDLKKFITKAARDINPAEARRACAAFRGHLERVLDADGGHIE